MARTITVTDDDSGVVTTVVVIKDEKGFTSVQEIRFTTLNGGGGLEHLDLSVLRDFGLTDRAPELPAAAAEPEPTPEPEPVVSSPAPRRRRGGPLARTRKADKLGRQYRRAPDAQELKRLFTKHGGASGVAQALDVPAHSVAGWLRRYRREGHVFELATA